MIVLIVQSVPPGLRGELSIGLLEPQAGVFVGNVSGAVRDLLWEKACMEAGEGSCTLIQQAANEQGFSIRTWGDPTRKIERWEGLYLVRRPNQAPVQECGEDEPDWDSCKYPNIWAKTPRGVVLSPGEGNYHPLICHMIDSAMVAAELWRRAIPLAVKHKIHASLGLDTIEETERWVSFIAGLHDLGKATPGFARKWEAGWKVLIEEGFRGLGHSESQNHYVLTTVLLQDILKFLGLGEDLAHTIARILGGHHGSFPTGTEIEIAAASGGKGKWPDAQKHMVLLLANVLGIRLSSLPGQYFAEDKAAQMILAGLTSVADWVASNHDCFPYQGEIIPMEEYPSKSRQMAVRALDILGWSIRLDREQSSFAEIFNRTPNSLQTQVDEVAEALQGPSLILLEYPMGGGKTEAALWLADYLSSLLGQQGIYFALPTMATSNQMFGRVNNYLTNRFPDTNVNTILLHGHASLHSEFARLKDLTKDLNMSENGGDYGLRAAEWFTYRKRGLLSPFGIGTVDQTLLSILQTPHFFVRLFGLAGKTVILDEVHAYDCYMQSLLATLLSWLAACNTSVILLSATLPAAERQKLLKAYAFGLGHGNTGTQSAEYPRISWVSGREAGCRHISGASPREVNYSLLNQDFLDSLCSSLKLQLSDGGCAVIILNTVKRAQTVYSMLKGHFTQEELILFHARYPFWQRAEIEASVLEMFGPGATNRPKRAVLVATQVVEQSLDLDFDMMVTDLAPIDLILQRSGRLWRHSRVRPASITQPILWILAPPGERVPPAFEQGSSRVYHIHTLLRSWLALKARGSLRIPENVEELIESVYSAANPPEELPDLIKQLWRQTADQLYKKRRKEESEAKRRQIPDLDADLFVNLIDRLDEDDEQKHPALRALTRLGGPSVTVVCLLEENGHLYAQAGTHQAVSLDDPPNMETTRLLLESSINLSFAPGIVLKLLETEPPRAWQTSVHLRRCRLLKFNNEGLNLDGYPLVLHPELGMFITTEGKEDDE